MTQSGHSPILGCQHLLKRWRHRLFRSARCRPAAARRHGRGFDRGGRGWLGSGPDRKANGLPNRRPDRRLDQKQTSREEFGYDEVIDYKGGGLADALRQACPRGVDVYFDNTAGAISDTVLTQLAVGARVVICGTASVANWDPPPNGPRVERNILVKRARMAGFLIFDNQHRYEEAVSRLGEWVRQGRLRYRQEISEGIEHCPGAIAELYRGENLGKRLIHLRDH